MQSDIPCLLSYLFVVIFLLIGGISYFNHLGSIKLESAAHLSGRAQNIFINGNVDEAMVKFERVLDDYPNTPGAVQSLVYLLVQPQQFQLLLKEVL